MSDHLLDIYYIDAWDSIAFEYDDVVQLLNTLGYNVEVTAHSGMKAVVTETQTMNVKQKVKVTIL